MPSALQPGPLFSQGPQNVMGPGAWLREGREGERSVHRVYPSYCPDLGKKQIIPVHHLSHPEYQKFPKDGVIC